MMQHNGGRLPVTQKLVIGFLTGIVLGSFLLNLPVSHEAGASLSYFDALFLSVSAVCVTGLTPVSIIDTLSVFGRTVLAILIQFGGIGYATFAIFLHMLLGQNIPFSQQKLAQEALNQETGRGITGLVKLVVTSSFIFEGVGAVVLTFAFRAHATSLAQAVGLGVFHSISAFNNAGFDLFGNSLMNWHDDILVNVTVSLLIIIGGIGFVVISDVWRKKRWERFAFHTKIVLSMTGILIAAGTLLIHATSSLSWLESLFLSVTSRTAGFNSVDTGLLNQRTLIVVMCLMWIGASPGSTGGGIKTTTFFTLLSSVKAIVGRHEATEFNRKISDDSISKAYAVTTISALLLVLGVFLLSVFEQDRSGLLPLVFEAISAFGTVGLSMGVTGTLGVGGKCILMVLMFVGRLGPVTIADSLRKCSVRHIHYMEESISIG